MANHDKRKVYRTSFSTALVFMFCAVPSVHALTPEQEVSNTVEVLCPQLAGINKNDPNALTAAEKDVLFRCGEVKRAPGQSFEQLSSSQINGLDNMTSSESSTMGTATVELAGAQNIAILGRLTVLRGKSSSSVASHVPTTTNPQNRSDGQSTFSNTGDTIPTVVAGNIEGTDENQVGLINGFEGGFSQMSEQGKWGFFLTGSYGMGDKDATLNEPGFDFDSWSLVTGVDYKISENFVLGAAFGYAMTNSSIDDNGGDVDLDGVGLSVYGSYYVKDFYFDFLAGYAAKEFDTTRNVQYSVGAKAGGTTTVNQAFNGDTDAGDINLALGAGYNINASGFTFTPFARLAYLNSDIDGYTESLDGSNSDPGFGLALTVDDQDVDSLTSSLGVNISRVINTSGSVITPYIRADWEHEFDNDARDIKAKFANVRGEFDDLNSIIIPTDEPDRDYLNFGAGVAALMPGGYQLFLDYSTIIGYEDLSLHSFVAGLRFEF